MKRIRLVAITLASLAVLAVTAPRQADAATDAFLLFSKPAGGAPTVTGESLDAAFPGAIEIKGFSFGAENPTTIGSTSGGAGAGKAKLNNLVIRKLVDGASPALMQALVEGRHYEEVTLALRRAAGVGAARAGSPYLVIKFKLVVVTKIDVTKGDEAPEEEVTLAYGAMSEQYFLQERTTGALKPTTPFQWNQITNTRELDKLPLPR